MGLRKWTFLNVVMSDGITRVSWVVCLAEAEAVMADEKPKVRV